MRQKSKLLGLCSKIDVRVYFAIHFGRWVIKQQNQLNLMKYINLEIN